MGQVTVANASTAVLFTVPPGLCNMTFWNVSAGTVFVGTSTAVTSANGMQCHSIPTSFFTYVSSKGATFYGANTGATSAVVNYLLSTDQA
jgi:hypothetical protein